MAISTYAELQDAILAWINKQDIEQSLDSIIAMTEADLNRKVRHWKMEKRATVSLDDQYSRVPSDWIETIRFYLTGNGTSELILASRSDLLNRRELANDTGGTPRYYTMSDGAFEVFPTSNGNFTAELLYYGKTDALSNSVMTNWLLTDHPDVYLYGSLVHASAFMGEDNRIQVWNTMYQTALDQVNGSSEAARYSGSGLRMKIRSYG
jgi:hypothetical protein